MWPLKRCGRVEDLTLFTPSSNHYVSMVFTQDSIYDVFTSDLG